MKSLNLLLVMVLLTSCDTGAARERRVQLCGRLATLDSTIATLRQIHSTSTTAVAAWNQAEARATAAFEAVQTTAQEVRGVETDQLKTAYSDLEQTVKQIPAQLNDPTVDPSTKAQIIAAIPAKVVAVESATQGLKTSLQCQQLEAQ